MLNKISVMLICILFGYSCKNVSPLCEDTEFTYNNDVKTIVDASCNTIGCHIQNATIGDFTTYEEMSKIFDNGKFKNHVFTLGDMPKGNILNFEDKAVLQCWMENGFLEKL